MPQKQKFGALNLDHTYHEEFQRFSCFHSHFWEIFYKTGSHIHLWNYLVWRYNSSMSVWTCVWILLTIRISNSSSGNVNMKFNVKATKFSIPSSQMWWFEAPWSACLKMKGEIHTIKSLRWWILWKTSHKVKTHAWQDSGKLDVHFLTTIYWKKHCKNWEWRQKFTKIGIGKTHVKD